MTRDEAIYKAQEIFESRTTPRAMADVVDFLVALGLLKLETPYLSALNYLRLNGYPSLAGQIIDELKRGGFKITREPT